MKVLITGASGFVGRHIVDTLSKREGITPVALVRKRDATFASNIQQIVISDITDTSEGWSSYVTGIEVIIHTAARVHVMNEIDANPLEAFRAINVDATLNLAKEAAKAGVRRFIFLSSIKVNGESTILDKPFTEHINDPPTDPYGKSKYEAEQLLLALSIVSKMDVVIIRAPLIYGPGVKANFKSMLQLVEKQIPLPFGAVRNKRSLIAVDNLVDFITLCLSHPKASNEVFLVSDDDDVSTAQLLKRVAKGLRKKLWLIAVPISFITILAKILGKRAHMDRVLGSLQVDISKAKSYLNWRPVVTMQQQLEKTLDLYLYEKNH